MLNDVRYAVRLLRRSPGFACAAILTLALGIGVNTAIYSVLQAVWIDAVPFADPSRLVSIASAGEFSRNMSVSDEDFADWRRESRTVASLGAVESGGTLRVNGQALSTAWASPDLFDTLRARMHLGRPLQAADGTGDAPIVAVLSHRTWQETFGGDPAVVGRILPGQAGPVEIVGVAPPGFQVSAFIPGAWVSRKVVPPEPGRRGGRSLQVFARLRDGVSVDEVRTEMNLVAARLAAARPSSNGRWPQVTVTPIRDRIAGPGVGSSLWLLLGATIVVLMIACANIANLFLARAAHRRREMAVRSALGARPSRIVRQMFCESAVVAAAATGAALLLTMWARDGIVAALPPDLHRGSEIGFDARVLIFTVSAGILAAMLTGMMPALRGSILRPLDLIAGSASRSGLTPAQQRFSKGLIAAEVALAVVVMSLAGLLMGSYLKLRRVAPGFDPRGVLTFNVGARAAALDDETRRGLHERIATALTTMPQVRAVGAAEMLPLSGNRSSYPHRTAEDGRTVDLDQRMVAPGYFEAMSIPIRAGRSFSSADTTREIVVNERAAAQLWPGRSALGQVVLSGTQRSTVIGVAGDVKHVGLDGESVAEVYRPSRSALELTYVVRTNGDLASIARQVEDAVEQAAPVTVSGISTLDDLVNRSIRIPQFRARLFGLMGLLVCVLAVVGVSSVTACGVAERRREIGIRMALGASTRQTVRLLLWQATLPALAGIVLGLTVAFNTNRLVAHFLFATSATDPVTVVGVVAGLLATVIAAAYIPARRAQRVDPTIALRSE